MKKTVKKVLSAFICTCFLALVFPVSSFAGSDYGIKIKDTHFTPDNLTIACGDGTAVLDITTNPYTLTLNNAEIDADGGDNAIRLEHTPSLTIKLLGTNVISNAHFGIRALSGSEKITICGPGSLNISASQDGLKVDSDIKIINTTVSSLGLSGSGICANNVCMQNSTIYMSGTNGVFSFNKIEVINSDAEFLASSRVFFNYYHEINISGYNKYNYSYNTENSKTGSTEVRNQTSITTEETWKYLKINATPVIFEDSESFDVPTSTIGTEITNINLAERVSGGTAPYTFSATNLPDGISLNTETGIISGSLSAASTAKTAIIKVTDANLAETTLSINFGAVTPKAVENKNTDTLTKTDEKKELDSLTESVENKEPTALTQTTDENETVKSPGTNDNFCYLLMLAVMAICIGAFGFSVKRIIEK